MFKRIKNKSITPLQYLINSPGLWRKSETERAKMSMSCRDTDYIPKVKNAGKIEFIANKKVQVMHNGLKVISGGYYGDWMANIIRELKGHHEPQEEKLFYEVLERIDKPTAMIELGSFWSYYSLWFLSEFPNSRTIACEPDPLNQAIGLENARLNKLEKRISFITAAAGSDDGKKINLPLDSDPTKQITVAVRTVDSLIDEYNIEKLDVLHMDVQGSEIAALYGAKESIKAKKIRFIFISTHHYVFSGDPITHQKCINFLLENGAHIIASHTIPESFSGDGLIVASLDKRDADLTIRVSLNSSEDSLFRPYEEDIALLIKDSKAIGG